MSEYTDSQGLEDDIRLALVAQIENLLHEHQQKATLKHHLTLELETLHEPPRKRHSLRKYNYDEMMREARERLDGSQNSEEDTHMNESEEETPTNEPVEETPTREPRGETPTNEPGEDTPTKEPEPISHDENSTPEPQVTKKKKMTAAERAQRRLEKINEEIKQIDERLLKRRQGAKKAEAETKLERKIDKGQCDMIDRDARFLLQVMDEPSIERLGETRDGLSERVHEIEEDIKVLRECLDDQNSEDEDTGPRAKRRRLGAWIA